MKNSHIPFAVTLLFVASSCLAVHAQIAAGADAKAPATPPGLDLTSIDKTADPCVDFYQYACGNFSKLHPIPADHASYGNFNILFDKTESILRGLLEKAAAGGANRTANEQKIGDYYASCMDIDAINREGLKPLQPELDRIAAVKSKEELTPLLAHFQLTNVPAFLGFSEFQDFKDASQQIAILDQAGLGLPERDYYLRTGDADKKIREQYVQHVTKTLKLIGEPDAKAGQSTRKRFCSLKPSWQKSHWT